MNSLVDHQDEPELGSRESLQYLKILVVSFPVSSSSEKFHEISSSESSEGTFGTPGLESVPSSVPEPPC
uniref:Uncharacterized protein n=1 Tax=Tanacetum cinerariifolium TaxID=118510 RepID=A0A699R8H8_TANCI|nr:hypothetical protein [Tanacetum cinerariifolium]